MPIYAYKCESCGLSKDVLQKMSDAPLTDCPACGQATFKKQVTAAGFQLKGSGWYATDFKGGATSAPAVSAGDAKSDTKSDTKSGGDSTAGGADTKSSGDSPSTPSKTESTPAAAGCGSGCACH